MNDKRLEQINISAFQEDLLRWYEENKRDLPWRENNDAYRVWVSEIMLQQTKVDTVIPYFNRFMKKYPTVYELAEAEQQDVLKQWEGLGYYSRARNLQTAVREVVETYDGKIPDDPKQLGDLKGVGPYTKGAILSIAYNQPIPAVDGNVMRVFSRVLHIEEDIALSSTKKLFEYYVAEMISKEDPSSFNQAIMDLGATICTPKQPMCMFCPVMEHCQAYVDGIQEKLPVKKKAKKQQKKKYIALLIQNQEGKYIIEKRPDSGLLAGLWQFPMIPADDIVKKDWQPWLEENYGLDVDIKASCTSIKHVFSHIIWNVDVRKAITNQETVKDDRLKFVSLEELKEFPFPVPHQKMIPFIEGK
ncbi:MULTISPECIES: A/G-specific adenine glycosylase [Oceanobacillus]|uniref:A/G-specific adenine glycosylase n=1 Tax=Oceanobacillus TaxID=182709 RepID=UPI00211720B6|nr:A/G-specific adenine glycosylase [Oceanobacillus oncorhynchi]UUI41641.1 A/G-specific adenine glycosylase [Oceanobacillus oncorhynchi]